MPRLDENLIAELVRRRVVSDTFRRLPPEKKRQIYDATIRLFGRYGYDGLAVERICRSSGISKGSFFQYFATKSHLLEFCLLVFDHRLADLFATIQRGDTAGLARRRLVYLYQM
ncbi:MAG: TetR/AcrR family transcriptional regulator, partial [Candidatus Zixiibacteriota bacterium]